MPEGSPISAGSDGGPPTVADANPDALEGQSYGAYTLFKVLVRAPGAILAEGRDSASEPVLLQLAPLRAAGSAAELAEREDYVHMVGRATQLLAGRGDPPVLDHGQVQQDNGAQLYWALPWSDGAQRLGHAIAQVESADHLTQAATALLERLHHRHEKGWLDPLLSAETLLLKPGAGIDVLGLSIHLPPTWLHPELMLAAPMAPEEQAKGEPQRAGDLWRAGRLLTQLASRLPRAPAPLVQVLEGLSADAPQRRFSNAEDALLEVESLQNTFAGNREDFEAAAQGQDETAALKPDDFPELPATAQGAERQEQPTVPSQDLPTAPDDKVGADAAADLLQEDMLGQATVGMDSPAADPTDHREDDQESDEDEDEDLEDSLDQDTSPHFPSPIGAERSPPASKPARGRVNPDREQATVRFPFPNPSDGEADDDSESASVPAGRVTHVAAPSAIPEGDTLLEIPRQQRSDPAPRATNIVSGAYESDDGSEFTVRDMSLEELARADEFPTMDEVQGKTSDTAWDRARRDPPFDPTKNRPGAGRPLPSKVAPMGPQGTLVGARLINDPTGLRQHHELPGMLPPPDLGQDASGPPVVADPLMPERRALIAPETTGPNAPVSPKPSTQDLLPPSVGAPAPAPVPPNALVAQPGLHPGSNPPAVPVAPPSMSPVPAPAHTSAPPPPVSASAPPMMAPPPAPRARSHVLLGALGFFVAGGLAALFVPSLLSMSQTQELGGGTTATAIKTYTITPANEVLLQASPASAVVVGERDGRPLGRTPLRFLVPPDLDVAILVAGDGHEPQRVTLPVRGRIRTDLVPLSDSSPCDLELQMPKGVALEGVSASLKAQGLKYTVPGAALARAKAGQGAWLVRCPRLGGTNPQALAPRSATKTVYLWVVGPSNATVFIDDKEVGTTPLKAEVPTGFRKIAVEKLSAANEKTERWVPIFGDTKIRMPRPRGK